MSFKLSLLLVIVTIHFASATSINPPCPSDDLGNYPYRVSSGNIIDISTGKVLKGYEVCKSRLFRRYTC